MARDEDLAGGLVTMRAILIAVLLAAVCTVAPGEIHPSVTGRVIVCQSSPAGGSQTEEKPDFTLRFRHLELNWDSYVVTGPHGDFTSRSLPSFTGSMELMLKRSDELTWKLSPTPKIKLEPHEFVYVNPQPTCLIPLDPNQGKVQKPAAHQRESPPSSGPAEGVNEEYGPQSAPAFDPGAIVVQGRVLLPGGLRAI